MKYLIVSLCIGLLPNFSHADQVRVAVASNFREAARALSSKFEIDSGHRVTLAFGSTGKHCAQIIHGAPFDVFLAADSRRPILLEDNNKAIAGSRFSYALGQLALWSLNAEQINNSAEILQHADQFRHIAIANPKLAPYGRAAQQVLQAKKQWLKLQPKILRGENIHQAFQFVHSGNAELGFVAWSQVKLHSGTGSYWLVPEELYDPIVQQGIQLSRKKSATEFVAYLQSDKAKKIIERFGYRVP